MPFALSRRGFIGSAAALSMAPAAADAARRDAAGPALVNPLIKNRADARIFRHEDGVYYMAASAPDHDGLVLRRSSSIAGLAAAEERTIWQREESGPRSGFLRTPALCWIDGVWHMYFSAGPIGGGENIFPIRSHAMACDDADPTTGQWRILGKVQTLWDSFNADPSLFVHRGVRYMVWAQQEPGIATHSNLYIAPMKTPLTFSAQPARLAVPTLDWEIGGSTAAQAPAILHRHGRLFMTYSASATDARCCLGLLSADENADLMNPNSWAKSQQPVFVTNRQTSVYGPGRNSFTVDEQGRDILVYHGGDFQEITGDPLLNRDRHMRVQRLYFTADGMPDFGVPVGNGPLPQRFVSAPNPAALLAHEGARLIGGNPALAQTQFRQTSGRAGKDSVMLSPVLMPDQYLVAGKDGTVSLQPDSKSADFSLRSQFVRLDEKGRGLLRFAAVGAPGKAIGMADRQIRLVGSRDDSAYWRVD